MTKRIISSALALIMMLSVFSGLTLNASAATSSDKNWQYTVKNGTATIDSYLGSASSVVIPSKLGAWTVTKIAEWAFFYCDSLKIKSITIPSTITVIEDDAFMSCESLTTFTVDANNPNYSSENGVLFNKDKTTLIRYPEGKKGTYSIPNSVAIIGNSAFGSCASLTSITIPNSVITIGKYAFYWCDSLKSIAMPDSVTSIGEAAFSWCDSLKSITIPDSVTSIGEAAFSYCSLLTSVTIPKGVQSIGAEAFAGCNSLKSITVDANNTKYSSASGVLFNKSKTKLLQYPGAKTGSYSIPSSVTTIDTYAFYWCESLTGVTIPSSVTRINEGAFFGCFSLKGVTIPKTVTKIEAYAFGFNSDSFKISCYNGSAAHKYAKNEEIPFKLLDTYTVTFKEGSKTLKTQKVNHGKKVSYKPTKKGYTLVGWYTSTKYSTKIDFSKGITKNTTAYARFVKNPSAPSSFKVKKVKSKQIKVSWKKQSGYTYVVEMSETGKSGSYKQIKSTKEGSYTKKDLKKGKTYYFKVYSYKTVDGVKVKSGYTSVKKTKA